MKLVAKGISYITHPLFMPFLGLVLLLELETVPASFYKLDALFYFPDEIKSKLYQICAILLFVAPLFSILIMRFNRMITSLEMEERKERTYPLVITSLYYALIFIFLRGQLEDPLNHPSLLGYLFGMVVVFIVCIFINSFWMKISLHAVGIFALIGTLIGYSQTQLPPFDALGIVPNFNWIIGLIILSGFIGFARLYLKAHTLREYILGCLIGFSIMFFTVKYGVYF
ncbi:MAG: hypothetical protein MK078_11090 [Crocinitomicaceae bacterium]|nr:hypothetical protein [Crocinitomicaceae bacterium]